MPADGRSVVSLVKKVAIAGVGHPASARQVAVVDAPAAFGLARRVEAEQNPYGLLPRGAVSSRIQQAHVEFEMRPVIAGEILSGWRDVREGFDHDADPIDRRNLSLDPVWSGVEALRMSRGLGAHHSA